jgi:hypothetical protein
MGRVQYKLASHSKTLKLRQVRKNAKQNKIKAEVKEDENL